MNKKKIKPVFLLLSIIACILIVWLCTITGAALAVSGAGYQGIFKNPMADPFVLGVSLGVAINSTLSAVMSFIMMLNKQSMDQIMFWTMGTLNGKGWNQIQAVLPWVVIGLNFVLAGIWTCTLLFQSGCAGVFRTCLKNHFRNLYVLNVE